ncbi:MAG: M20/M25/M40 family metallo-hydrolase [Acidobacteriota bacterium]
MSVHARPLSALLVLSLIATSPTLAERASERVHPVATYSIVARDAETGHLGVAVQSHWFSVGSIVTWAEAGVGAVATQSFARAAYGPELLADLRGGMSPDEAMAKRTTADEGRDVRQVAVVDATGRVAAHTGSACIASAGHVVGDQFSVQANIMVDDDVVPAMAAGYRRATGDLAERMLQAMEAAQEAGGDLRGKQSAAILIVDGEKQDEPWQGVVMELRVEDHPHPLEELRRLVGVHRAYEAANAGDERLAEADLDGALREYARASELLPEQVELAYWRAIGLLSAGHEKEALPLLKDVLAKQPLWAEITPRLAAAGHLEADAALLKKMAALARSFELSQRAAGARADRLEKDVRKQASFHTRHTLSETGSDRRGIGAARRWLADELKRISREHHGGRLRVELAEHRIPPNPRLHRGAVVVNVVGTLPGTDPDRLVVVSGHYDSRASDRLDATSAAPGANDDASGVAAAWEAARLLGGLHPRATLVFMAVAGEEQGLHGARAQAEQWKKEGKTVEAFLTLDIVGGATGSNGRKEPWKLRVFSEGVPSEGRVVGSDNDSSSRQLARYLLRAGSAAVPGFEIVPVFRQDRFLRGGDHRPFNALGWPGIRLTEPNENYGWQHQDVRAEHGVQFGDLPDNVDYDYLARVTAATAATLGELALAPRPPADVIVDISKLTPDSTLRWSPDLLAERHAVLRRRTHEPGWTHRDMVPAGQTELTLEGVSKDDWLFAVEAIGADGSRSLPVYPTPHRGR